MKKVVESRPISEISIDEISSVEFNHYYPRKVLFAYQSTENSVWCFLANLSVQGSSPLYGFVAMNYTDTWPRFVGNSLKESLKLAVKSREVYMFNGIEELAYTIINKK